MIGLEIVVTIGYVMGTAALGFLLYEVRALRRDVLHAGIDIHEVLVTIAGQQRVSLMSQTSQRPEVADAVTEESPEAWLDRMRKRTAERQSR